MGEHPEKPVGPPPPKVGDDIYVDTALYVYRGRDDFIGGLAKVSRILVQRSARESCYFIEVEERPGMQMNWSQVLAGKQLELRRKFGNQRAHADPDERPEFNDDDADWRP